MHTLITYYIVTMHTHAHTIQLNIVLISCLVNNYNYVMYTPWSLCTHIHTLVTHYIVTMHTHAYIIQLCFKLKKVVFSFWYFRGLLLWKLGGQLAKLYVHFFNLFIPVDSHHWSTSTGLPSTEKSSTQAEYLSVTTL